MHTCARVSGSTYTCTFRQTRARTWYPAVVRGARVAALHLASDLFVLLLPTFPHLLAALAHLRGSRDTVT